MMFQAGEAAVVVLGLGGSGKQPFRVAVIVGGAFRGDEELVAFVAAAAFAEHDVVLPVPVERLRIAWCYEVVDMSFVVVDRRQVKELGSRAVYVGVDSCLWDAAAGHAVDERADPVELEPDRGACAVSGPKHC